MNPIYFEFVHQYEGVSFECTAEVYVEMPIPDGDSDWDTLGLREVTEVVILNHPSICCEDIQLTDEIILRYFDLHVEMMINEGF
ncbi:hypothetical protein VP496E541_P0097 [Vibrio phage 496E54-1]|nr:hypothetical protein VP495E541_P0096 [Vibrio phage 495E54-1]CAH9013496.1 hypothetical protein VP496E541_P0097 [Vibrio phage 496E54-1]